MTDPTAPVARLESGVRPGVGVGVGVGLGVGLDIGGTSTKAGLVDAAGTVLASVVLPSVRGVDGVLATSMAAVHAVLAEGGLSLADLDVVGVGIPGTVDPDRGTVHHAVNLGIGPDVVPLVARLEASLGRPVHVENDVRAAALGADWFVARERGPVDDLAYLSIGTGIAAGHVRHGTLVRGNRSVVGEIGHVPIDPNGPPCACGQIGCIEAISSGSAIERLWPTPGGSAAVALHRAAVDGDVGASAIWHDVVGGLARAVLVLALTWDPDVVVLSGGVASVGDGLRDSIADRLAADAALAAFLVPLQLGERLHVVDPSVPLGPIGAVLAARAALGAGAAVAAVVP